MRGDPGWFFFMPGSRARSDLSVYAWITPSFALDAGTLSVAVETEAHQLALGRDGASVADSRGICGDRAQALRPLSVEVVPEAHQLALLRDGAGVKISRSNCRERAQALTPGLGAGVRR